MYWLNFDKRSTYVSKYMCIRDRTVWFSSDDSDSYEENFQENASQSYKLYFLQRFF